jgi:hypothetical protein
MRVAVFAIEVLFAKSDMSSVTIRTVRGCSKRFSEVLRVTLIFGMESGTNETFVVVVCRRILRLRRTIFVRLMVSFTDLA